MGGVIVVSNTLHSQEKLIMWNKIKNFFGGARQELRHVTWPSRSEAIRLTFVVVIASIILAVFLGAFDLLFTYVLRVVLIK